MLVVVAKVLIGLIYTATISGPYWWLADCSDGHKIDILYIEYANVNGYVRLYQQQNMIVFYG